MMIFRIYSCDREHRSFGVPISAKSRNSWVLGRRGSPVLVVRLVAVKAAIFVRTWTLAAIGQLL